jgi:hypothetical protein
MAATPDFSARSSFEAQLAGSPVCVIDESIAEEALLALLKGVRDVGNAVPVQAVVAAIGASRSRAAISFSASVIVLPPRAT